MSKNLKISLGLVVIALVALVVAIAAGAGDDDIGDVASGGGDTRLVRSDSLVLSEGSSDVEFVEFLDFECEACYAAFPAVEELRAEYGDRMTFVVRHFPLHANSMEAALAAEAAAEQGALEEMYTKLFEAAPEWGHQNASQEDAFFGYAEQLGLDMDRFRAVYDDPATYDKVLADKADGQAVGVTGTPSFFLDGDKLEVRNFDTLIDRIEQALGD